MNNITLVGRLTKNVELLETNNGTTYAKFSLAVDRQDKEKNTDFFNCIIWNKGAEIVNQYCHKGDRLAVSGQLQFRSYDKDGYKFTTHDVVVRDFTLLGEKKTENEKPKMTQIDYDADSPF